MVLRNDDHNPEKDSTIDDNFELRTLQKRRPDGAAEAPVVFSFDFQCGWGGAAVVSEVVGDKISAGYNSDPISNHLALQLATSRGHIPLLNSTGRQRALRLARVSGQNPLHTST